MINNNPSVFRLALVIPFFNEEKRITSKSFTNFADEHKEILLILVDDGSSDNTLNILEKVCVNSSSNTELIHLDKNLGKGNTIRLGMMKAIDYQIPYIGYLDADLSAPFEELVRLYDYLQSTDDQAVFGSRLKKLGSDIKRTVFRHLVGRMIATLIDNRFKIGCYDTQCSAKIFKTDSLTGVLADPFYTKWFFDIELILRIRKKFKNFKIQEIPLNKWEHKPGSKINVFSVFHILKEIMLLFSKY